KAYLVGNVEIRWSCAKELLRDDATVPAKETIHFAGGLLDFLNAQIGNRPTHTDRPFAGTAAFNGEGRVEWAVAWPGDEEGFFNSYVNTVPTPQGGSHEQGFR